MITTLRLWIAGDGWGYQLGGNAWLGGAWLAGIGCRDWDLGDAGEPRRFVWVACAVGCLGCFLNSFVGATLRARMVNNDAVNFFCLQLARRVFALGAGGFGRIREWEVFVGFHVSKSRYGQTQPLLVE